MSDTEGRIFQSGVDLDRVLSQIAERAANGKPITVSPEGWVEALPHLADVACRFEMEDSIYESYIWYDNGSYYASNLGPGLEDREETALDRYEAMALLEGGIMNRPVPMSEVDDAE